MIRTTLLTALLSLILILSTGCGRLFDINLSFVGEQTSLERQVLGTYSALGEDLLIYSSVRGVTPDGDLRPAPPTTESQRVAFSAMRNRQYNRDDIDRLLAAGFIGESNQGLLESRTPTDPENLQSLTAAQVGQLIAEENLDRQAILARLVETAPNVTDEQLPQVFWIFATLNHDAAPAGSWIQNQRGQWRRK